MRTRSFAGSRETSPCPVTMSLGFSAMRRPIRASHALLSASPTKGKRPVKRMSPEKTTPSCGHDDHEVLGRVRRAEVLDLEAHAPEREGLVAVEPAVRVDERCLAVHPGKEVPCALLAPALGFPVREVFERAAMGPDLRSRVLERLQAVEVVGVVMGHDDTADRLARDSRGSP